jgi:hypothetical protein
MKAQIKTIISESGAVTSIGTMISSNGVEIEFSFNGAEVDLMDSLRAHKGCDCEFQHVIYRTMK